MNYIKIEIDTIGAAYQENNNGVVTRYIATDGTELFLVVPIGLGSAVIDANPPRLDWMI